MFIFLPGQRKIHYTFPDETEMVEEYDVSSGELLGKLNKRNQFLYLERKPHQP